MKRTIPWFALVALLGFGALGHAQAPSQGAAAPPVVDSDLPHAGAPGATVAERGLSNRFNPAVSANLLMLGGYTSRPEDHEADAQATVDAADAHAHQHGAGDMETGLTLQEVEVLFSAAADPFVRVDITLAAHMEEIGFEEAYLSTLAVPRTTIRAGRMLAAFGKHNRFHTHAFPFVTAPLPSRALFGADGLSGDGVSVELLLPTPFFAELTGQAFGPGEMGPISAAEPHDLRYVGRLRTLLDLGRPTTLEVGGSYFAGRNDAGRRADVVGGDVTLKWSPLAAQRYRGLEWTSEVVWADANEPGEQAESGLYSGLRAQAARRWWVQSRGAVLGLDGPETVRAEGLVGFVPSEFTALRLQYAAEVPEHGDVVHEAFLQVIVSIGSHPAHAY